MYKRQVYEGEITLGFSTMTEDASGEVVERTPVEAPLDVAEVDRMIAQMVGEIEQVPPMYSAVKVLSLIHISFQRFRSAHLQELS